MKIDSLHIRNFRGIEDFRLSLLPDRPTVVTGLNGAGKTTIFGALSWLLTGENPSENKDAPLLRDDNRKLKGWVGADLTIGESIRRVIHPHALEIEGVSKKAGLYGAQQRLCELAGISSTDAAILCLRPDNFLRLSSKDQAGLFWTILKVAVTKQMVADRLAEMEATLKLPVLAVFAAAHGEPSGNLEAQRKSCYDHRTNVNRDLKKVKGLIEAFDLADEEGTSPAFVVDVDREELSRLRLRRDRLVGAQAVIAANEREIKAAGAQAEEFRGLLKDAPSAETVAAASVRLQAYKDELAELLPSIDGLREKRREAASLDAAPSCCPTCAQAWPDAAARAAKFTALEAEIDALVPVDRKVLELRASIAKGEAYMTRAANFAHYRQTLAALESRLATMEAPTDSENLDAELATVDAQIAALSAQTRAHQEWRAYGERKQAAQTELRRLDRESKALTYLVDLFDVRGIKSEVLRVACGPVADQMSATLAQWDMASRLNDDLELEVLRHGKWRLSSSCSAGEKLLVGLSLQVWLAQTTGLRILAIDGVEQIDDENRALLFAACEDLLEAGEVDHAIVCGLGLEYPGAVNLGAVMAQTQIVGV